MRKQSHKWSIYAPFGDGKEGNLSPLWLSRETWFVSSIHVVVSRFLFGQTNWCGLPVAPPEAVLPFPKTASLHCSNQCHFFLPKCFSLMCFSCGWKKPSFHVCMNFNVLPEQWRKTFTHRLRVSVAPQPERRSEDDKAGLKTGMSHNPCGCVTSGMQHIQQLAARARSGKAKVSAGTSRWAPKKKATQWAAQKCHSPSLQKRVCKSKGSIKSTMRQPIAFYSVSRWLFLISLPRKISPCSFPIR